MTSRSDKHGGPAFPCEMLGVDRLGVTHRMPGQGMTLRDYFAAKAMQGLMSCSKWNDHVRPDSIAEEAYIMADAMLKAREQ